MSSLIRADLTITGTVVSVSDVEIDGRIEGEVRAHSVRVSDTGLVVGKIRAQNLQVLGRVEGHISARTVQLTSTANVSGDIEHACLLGIELGATFEGTSHNLGGEGASESTTEPASDNRPQAAQPTAATLPVL